VKLADASARQIKLIVDLLEETKETWRRIRDLEKSLESCQATVDNQKIALSRSRRAFKNLPYGVYVKDTNMRYLYCNDAYAMMMNLRPADFKGKTDRDLFSEEIAIKLSEREKQVRHSGRVTESEEKHLVHAKERTFLVARRIFKGDEGDGPCLLGIMVDITDMKNKEEALRIDLEKQISQRDIELEQLRNGLRHHLSKIADLQNIADSTRKFLDSLEEPI
jgi:PAS domain S-box-containing protein